MGADELHGLSSLTTLPQRTERRALHGKSTAGNGQPPTRKVADSEPLSLFVFKTVSDPFAGRISYFKVYCGVLKNDATRAELHAQRAGKAGAHLGDARQSHTPVNELHAGDIGAVAKLSDTLTGDTLGDKDAPIQYPQ